MEPYGLTLAALLTAIIAQSLAAGLCAELAWHRAQIPAERRIWLAFAIAMLLAALHHGYSLELAVRAGLFDLRQAVIAAISALLFAAAAWGLRRRSP
jgi:hypothetical protein